MSASLKLFRLGACQVQAHWTVLAFPLLAFVRGWVLADTAVGLLHGLAVAALMLLLLLPELVQFACASRLGIGVRSILLTPVGGLLRLARLSERPWQEIWVAAIGPLAHAGLLVILWNVAQSQGISLEIETHVAADVSGWLHLTFWLCVASAILSAMPAFPFDGGQGLRAILAMSAYRLRATEKSAAITSIVALFAIITGMVWMSALWWLIPLGIFMHVSGRQEVLDAGFFDSLINPPLVAAGASPPSVLPVDQVIAEDAMPSEPDFSGYIYSARTRLWVVWQEGRPVCANALINE